MTTLVLTILESVVSSIVGVVLASHLQNRSSTSERKQAAYESFITSAAIVVGRTVLSSENYSCRQRMYSVVSTAMTVLGSLFLWLTFNKRISASELTSLLRHGMRTTMSYQAPTAAGITLRLDY
jgi:hypothetical protein